MSNYETTPKVDQDRSHTAKMSSKHKDAEIARLREKFPNGTQDYEFDER